MHEKLSTQSESDGLIRALEKARKKLLESANKRSTFLHANRKKPQANRLNIIDGDCDGIFDALCGEKKRTLPFKPTLSPASPLLEEEELAEFINSEMEQQAADNQEKNDGQQEKGREGELIESDGSTLFVRLEPEKLAYRLKKIARDAHSLEEEKGLNLLFLVMGFLRWRERADSQTEYEAPLILLPVELVEVRKSSSYRLQFREEEMTVNLPLQERLRQDFGINLPDIAEDRDDNWCPSSYFKEVEEAIFSSQKGWSIDCTGLQLGFFSFDKLQMYHDLDSQSWPQGWIENHKILNNLLCRRVEEEERDIRGLTYDSDGSLDKLYSPMDLIHILDADASQTLAIEAVRTGKNLVIQGPPGTGKSQTIANILAAAAHDGKTVLFVAEKQAALSVVYDRLVKCGLSDICLELHSHKANKKHVLQELDRTLANSAKRRKVKAERCAQQLHHLQGDLNDYTDRLHLPLEEGEEKPYDALCDIIAYRGLATVSEISTEGLEKLGKEARNEAVSLLHRLIQSLEKAGDPEIHPFKGVRQLDLQPLDIDRLKIQLDEAIDSLDRLVSIVKLKHFRAFQKFIDVLHILDKVPDRIFEHIDILFPLIDDQRLKPALETGIIWQDAYLQAVPIFLSDAFSINLVALEQAITAGKSSLWQRWFGSYRQACTTLKTLLQQEKNAPKLPDDYLILINQLIDLQTKRAELTEEETWLQQHLQHLWQDEKTEFPLLVQICDWIRNIKATGFVQTSERLSKFLKIKNPSQRADNLRKKLDEARDKVTKIISILDFDLDACAQGCTLFEADLSHLRHLLERMKETERYEEWNQLQKAIKAAQLSAASQLVERILNGDSPSTKGIDEFLYACAGARWQHALKRRPQIYQLRDIDRHLHVKKFVDLEKEHIKETRQHVLAQYHRQVPQGYEGTMGIIRTEINKKRRIKSIRRLVKETNTTIQRIKPIFLMSPLSVAQYLMPGFIKFDILVIDEASQIKPEEALGCIARSQQLVVVGDKKQLPPTSYFNRIMNGEADDEEEEGEDTSAAVGDMESILTLCEASNLEQCMLRWHYRSRDPSLMQISNEYFYDGQLALPSPPRQRDEYYGLKFRRVEGVYSSSKGGSGRARTNRIEAEAIVMAVREHVRQCSNLSLGIVSFSNSQADMIMEVLDQEMRTDPHLEAFYRQQAQNSEPLFVKSLENVQGDERDVILISVCYGPRDIGGRLASQNFGPINSEGGERRLNVLFSRARCRCEVFASFDPSDIDPTRAKNRGSAILKKFLEFARDEVTGDKIPTGGEAESPFEEDVAREIEKLGFNIHHQVGSEGFRIDIAVLHPDKPWHYILAVECDGARYHSSFSAKERDRLRQEVLEKQGWRFHRIWSTDWYYRKGEEIARLAQALEQAQGEMEEPSQPPVLQPLPPTEIVSETREEKDELIDQPKWGAIPYAKADNLKCRGYDLYRARMADLADLVRRIVEIEGPIHQEEIARRMASAFGLSKAGTQIQSKRAQAVGYARKKYQNLRKIGNFVCTAQQQDAPPVRDRSNIDQTTRRAEHLSTIEILAAAEMLRERNGDMNGKMLSQAIANLLGFQRCGPDLLQVIDDAFPKVDSL